ncbi:hypothetical protein AX17_006369 [Amanita inopinata Kibby_2008]|nr:hypothetical protein AX17_006369 [Amanita inopinata Kibby_2008]
METKNDYTIDLLLICGDFQAVRNWQDLHCMAVPNKYKDMKDFYKYYTGEKTAPVLTLVIGGNHEASNYLWELHYGGWLAPNIYYLGHAGCVQVNGIRIAGASGIFKPHDFRLGYYERPPYNPNTIRSTYHIREYAVRKLSLLSPPQIFLSHDWPQSIEHYGNLRDLLHRKSFLRQDINSGSLGSPPLMSLLKTLKPNWWFAAHLHTRYEATVYHENFSSLQAIPAMPRNPDEIVIDDVFEDDVTDTSIQQVTEEVGPEASGSNDVHGRDYNDSSRPSPKNVTTRFLALDKCLPKRKFLEVIDLPSMTEPDRAASRGKRYIPALSFDAEWLAITRAFHPWLSTTRLQRQFPDESDARRMVGSELDWIAKNVAKKLGENLEVLECQTFRCTAPAPDDVAPDARGLQPPYYPNPQTKALCALLELENKIDCTVAHT